MTFPDHHKIRYKTKSLTLSWGPDTEMSLGRCERRRAWRQSEGIKQTLSVTSQQWSLGLQSPFVTLPTQSAVVSETTEWVPRIRSRLLSSTGTRNERNTARSARRMSPGQLSRMVLFARTGENTKFTMSDRAEDDVSQLGASCTTSRGKFGRQPLKLWKWQSQWRDWG